MTIFSCTVNRYGTMSATTPARTDAAAGEDEREDRRGVESCKRPEDVDAVAGRPRIGGQARPRLSVILQRAAYDERD